MTENKVSQAKENKKFHYQPIETLFTQFKSSSRGLSATEAALRLASNGPNMLPTKAPPTLLRIFLQQFLNPLIYILGVAAIISMSLIWFFISCRSSETR